MFEENEVLTLILGVISVAVVLPFSRRSKDEGILKFCAGTLFLALSYLFTNLESMALHDVFNTCEHLCFALGALCFLLSVPRLGKGEVGR